MSSPQHPLLYRLRDALIVMGVIAVLSSCGGGGGGGSSSSSSSTTTVSASAVTTVGGAFPVGLAMGLPTALSASSGVISGMSDLISPATSYVPEQAVLSSQTDAVVYGRSTLLATGAFSDSALFTTSTRAHASCYGPAVAYTTHDDNGSSGTLSAGEVGLWQSISSGVPCAAAELRTYWAGQGQQTQQSLLLLAAMRRLISSNSSLAMPAGGQTVSVSSQLSSLLSSLSSAASVSVATISASTDGTEYTYRIVLTRGSGASAQSLEIALIHNPLDSDTHYGGTLQITLGYLSTDSSITGTQGCTDQKDSSNRYKLARISTLNYARDGAQLTLRQRQGQYCGNPTLPGTSHINELATTTNLEELDPTVYLSGSTQGGTLGWRQGFTALSMDVDLSTLGSSFIMAWQDSPQNGTGQARILAGQSDLSSGTRSVLLAHGYTPDLADTSNTDYSELHGMVCNWSGPGATQTLHTAFQYQSMSLGSSASDWTLGTSNISYAPTNSCTSSSTMRYDVDASGVIDSGEGASVSSGLYTPSSTVYYDLHTVLGISAPALSL
jgi:hypothetical protein